MQFENEMVSYHALRSVSKNLLESGAYKTYFLDTYDLMCRVLAHVYLLTLCFDGMGFSFLS